MQAALSGTALAACSVCELEIDEESDVLIVDELHQEPDALIGAWRTCRRLVEVVGRWPVLVPIDWELYHEPEPAELSAFVAAAPTLDPWPRLISWVDTTPLTADELQIDAHPFDEEALRQKAIAELTFPTTQPVVDRWTYDRLVRDRSPAGPTDQERQWGTTSVWYWPKEAQLVLLPTTSAWLAPAWLSYFGTLGMEREFIAACWQWHQRYGAEMVACWGTMLQFFVERPPALGDAAWELAVQLKAVGGSLDVSTGELAFGVSQGNAWFLHDRP